MSIEHEKYEHRPSHEFASEVRKCLIVVAGPNLSGKTTVSRALAERLNVDILDIDQSWRARWGTLENRPKMPEVYDYNHSLAQGYINQNKPVIITATYSKQDYHNKLIELSSQNACPLRVFVLQFPQTKNIYEAVSVRKNVEERLEKRVNDPNDQSDIRDLETALRIQGKYEPINDLRVNDPNDADIQVYKLNALENPEENINFIVESLSDLKVNN